VKVGIGNFEIAMSDIRCNVLDINMINLLKIAIFLLKLPWTFRL
jgi:hypothetical protein